MNQIHKDFENKYIKDNRVRSVIMVQRNTDSSQLTDGFDVLILVVTEQRESINFTSHYIKEPYRIQERWIHKKGIDSWILNGDNRNIIQWLLNGEILIDKDGYLDRLKHQLLEYPCDLREKRLFMEFCYFVRCHTLCKEYLQSGHAFDAYNSVLEALIHWARMVVIQHGYHPEVTVWNQIRKIEPSVYKVYEEFIHSQETIEQRIQLAQLASEFSVFSKMKTYCSVILHVLESRDEPWSALELKEKIEFSDLHVELAFILTHLVKRGIIKSVTVPIGDDFSILEQKYTIPKRKDV